MSYMKDYDYGSARTIEANATTYAAAYKNMYGWMACGLGLTALTAMLVSDRMLHSDAFAEMMLSKPVFWILAIAIFGLVWGISAAVSRLSFPVASALFATYAVLNGAFFAPLFLVYTASSIAMTFFITAGTFGGMALYGHVTKRDLSKLGSICIMGLWGVILASIVNIFMGSSMMHYIISYIAIAIFCGLTMYDVQKFKDLMNEYGASAPELLNKIALLGALSLYLDFINLFIRLLSLLGKQRD